MYNVYIILFSIFIAQIDAVEIAIVEKLIEDLKTPTPKLIGNGDWGPESAGIACRITADKQNYSIGDRVHIFVEIANRTHQPVTLGVNHIVAISFVQGHSGNLGYFCTYHLNFSNGNKLGRKPIIVEAGKTYSEQFSRIPWGPNYGCYPSKAQPGEINLSAQYSSSDSGMTSVMSNQVKLLANNQSFYIIK